MIGLLAKLHIYIYFLLWKCFWNAWKLICFYILLMDSSEIIIAVYLLSSVEQDSRLADSRAEI